MSDDREHLMTAEEWRCVCGSGDDGEWHTAACAISNTPDDVWYGTEDAARARNDEGPNPSS